MDLIFPNRPVLFFVAVAWTLWTMSAIAKQEPSLRFSTVGGYFLQDDATTDALAFRFVRSLVFPLPLGI